MLFKRFADVDVFDIEVDDRGHVDEIIRFCELIAPTFGGINLEDIRAPECFEIEETLKESPRHPGLPRRSARHGDHLRRRAPERTLELQGKKIEDVKVVFSGAGASAIWPARSSTRTSASRPRTS